MAQKHTPAPTRRQIAARKNASRPRLPKRLREAVHAIVYEGKSRKQAAEAVGMRDHSLREALKRPHVRALMHQEFEALQETEKFRSYARQIELAEASKSDDVRFKSNAWIAGCAGLAPVQKVQAQHHVTHAFEGIGFEPPETIDGQSEHVADAEEAVVVDASEPAEAEVEPAEVMVADDDD